MNSLQKLIAFIGRAAFSLMFILSGFLKIFNWQEAEDSIRGVITNSLVTYQEIGFVHDLLQVSLDWIPTILGVIVAVELVGGIMLFFGVRIRLASFFLLLYLVPATILLHGFWNLQGPERAVEMNMFAMGISLCGALLILLSYGNPLNKSAKKSAHSKKGKHDED